MRTAVQVFQRLLGTENVLLQGLAAYNTDFFAEIPGNAKVVLRPKTCAEVSALMKYCSTEGISVVPQGGNTGLCGANIAQKGEVLVSMGRMTEVLEIDEDVPAVHVSAGHTLEAVIDRARSKGFLFPLDLGAKGSCQIGGNLATNAGGLRFLRYGSLHANTLALEVVLSSGEVLSDFCHMRKNNTAYDLKQLFIGSEGTLGLITKAAISLYPFPRSIQVAVFGCAGFSEVLGMYSLAKQRLHEVLSAFEYFDRRSLGLVLQHIPNTRDPLSTAFPYYVLVETHGSDDSHDFEKLSSLLESTGGMQVEGVLAKDERERLELWRLRETCAVAYAKSGPTHVYDFSLPIARFEDTVQKAEKIVGSDGVVVGLGHLGDSNLHIGVIHPPGKSLSRDTESRIYQTVMDCNGSISAEHGIGTIKKGDLWRKGRWTAEEKALFLKAYEIYGNQWSKYTSLIPTRDHKQIRSHAQKSLKKGLLALQEELNKEKRCKCLHALLIRKRDASVQCDELDVALECLSPSSLSIDQASTADDSSFLDSPQPYI